MRDAPVLPVLLVEAMGQRSQSHVVSSNQTTPSHRSSLCLYSSVNKINDKKGDCVARNPVESKYYERIQGDVLGRNNQGNLYRKACSEINKNRY